MTDLLDLASAVVGWAAPGEQVEAYVARSRTGCGIPAHLERAPTKSAQGARKCVRRRLRRRPRPFAFFARTTLAALAALAAVTA